MVSIARRMSKRGAADLAADASSARRQGSVRTDSSASARATGSRGGTSSASVGPNCSAIPPTAVATIGRPSAAASITATGRPSHADASTKTSHAAMTVDGVRPEPGEHDVVAEPELVSAAA